MTDKKLESLAYRLRDLTSLRELFSELNFDFEDKPVNKDSWRQNQKDKVTEARIVASKNNYLVCYIRTSTNSLKDWKGISSRIIKDNSGLCMVCSHNPDGLKWVFSSLSKNFSQSFSETRHVPIDITKDSGVPKTFIDFLEAIKIKEDTTTTSIATQISNAFDSFAVQIHDELTVNVFKALKILSEGIIMDESNQMHLDEQSLKQIREPVFILLYRIIFVLYADDRGIFPIDNNVYYNEFSLKWIKREWLLKRQQHKITGQYEVQKRLWHLFRLVELGSEDLDYDPEKFFMKSYYGRLFDRQIHSRLEKYKIKNEYLLDAISLLTRTHDRKGNYFFLDYSALETRHLGSIYEHLLEYHLTIKDQKIAELPNPKDRKASGSYYTPQYIVDYIVKNTVKPLIDNIVNTSTEPDEQIEKILDLNVLDPAMGSGHFLIGVTNYIARRLCEIECSGEITEQAFVERKRDVARRCIYGVDLNPLAVDLAHVSLWLETLSSEKPLSFLSAHLKSGNALIGASISDIFAKQTTLMESAKSRMKFKKTIRDFIMLEHLEDDTAAAVKTKIAKYEKIQSKGTIYYQLKFLLDAKVAIRFSVEVPPLGEYVAKKIGESGLDFYADNRWQQVKESAKLHSFFHWDLEFPSIFYDENGKHKTNPGFDVVIGNPPYINVENLSKDMRKYCLAQYQTCEGRTDIYIAFIEKTLNILSTNGLMNFIMPSAFAKQKYATKMRQMLINDHDIIKIDDVSNYRIFKHAAINNIIITIGKGNRLKSTKIIRYHQQADVEKQSGTEFLIDQKLFTRLKDYRFDTNPDIIKYIKIKEKICEKSIRLGKICLIAYGARLNHRSKNISKSNYIKSSPEIGLKKFCEGRDIQRYSFSHNSWLKYTPNEHYNPMFKELFENPKLMCINIVKDRIRWAYDDQGFYNSHTVVNCIRFDFLTNVQHTSVARAMEDRTNTKISKQFTYKFLLAILNSQLVNWYFINFLSENLHFYPNDAKALPILKIDSAKQKIFVELVEDIMRTKKNNPMADTKILENKIDELVYDAYQLTSKDRAIVEKQFE